MRLEGGLDGIELGPQLGRGSYGKVFKGAPALYVCRTQSRQRLRTHPQAHQAAMLCMDPALLIQRRNLAVLVANLQDAGVAPSLLSRSWSTPAVARQT